MPTEPCSCPRPESVTARNKLLWAVPAIFTLLLFAYLGRYAFPIADDHSYGTAYRELGLWRIIAQTYLEWSGRYIANALAPFLGSLSDNVALYHVYPALHIALLVLSLRFFVSCFHKGSAWDARLITVILAASFLAGMPSLSQGLYWMCGAVTYFLAFPAMFIAVGCLGRYAFCVEKPGKGYAALCVGSLFICMGCNEVSAAVAMFFLVCACVAAYVFALPQKRAFAAFTVWGAAFFLLAYAAPGNFVRADIIENEWQWKFVLHIAGGAFEGYKWLARTPFLPAVFLAAFLFAPRWRPENTPYPAKKRLLFLLLLGCLLFLGEFLLVYVTSKRPPYARINNAIYQSAFLFGLAGAGVMLGQISALAQSWSRKLGRGRVFSLTALVFCITLLAQPSVFSALRNEAGGEFAAYRDIWVTRLAMLPPREEAAGVTLTVPPLRSRPYPIVFRDLQEKQAKHQWIAKVFAEFHGLKKVVVAPR